MIELAVIVSIAGDEIYFKFASISIPSFLRNCHSVDLFVFTDRPEEIERLGNTSNDRFNVIDLNKQFNQHDKLISQFRAKIVPIDSLHKNIFVSPLLPIAEEFLKNKKYNHILKIDCDSYFAGGDVMQLVKEDIHRNSGYELYLIERTHELMSYYDKNKPGTGFVLWKKGGEFINKYINNFGHHFQPSILNMVYSGKIKTKILDRPGYHFVYPFLKAERVGKEFTKEIASQFLPAYFHLNSKNAYKNMEIMKKWFN